MSTPATLTPRSRSVWAAQLRATAPDRDALARKAGITRAEVSRMLSGRSPVPDDLARKLAELYLASMSKRPPEGAAASAKPYVYPG